MFSRARLKRLLGFESIIDLGWVCLARLKIRKETEEKKVKIKNGEQ
jgi:hypothetical protein